jgi:hypothetical protein
MAFTSQKEHDTDGVAEMCPGAPAQVIWLTLFLCRTCTGWLGVADFLKGQEQRRQRTAVALIRRLRSFRFTIGSFSNFP